jgi:Opacity family porin protein
MERASLIAIFFFFLIFSVKAQTQKGTVLVGSDISQLNLGLQGHNNTFSVTVDPQMGIFIRNNKLIGAQLTFGLSTQNGTTVIQYGLSAFGRYYFGNDSISFYRKHKWFIEANAGPFGNSTSGKNVEHTSTNGLGIGIGPGFSYFLTSNVALEALIKYDLTLGFGSSTTNNAIGASLGLQIFFPVRKFRMINLPKGSNN